MSATVKNNMREIMSRAWMLVKTYGMKMAEALRQSWMVARLKAKMAKGIVKFAYEKVTTGEHRTAWGTLCTSEIPADAFGTNQRATHPTCVKYWDKERLGWRQFKAVNLLSIA